MQTAIEAFRTSIARVRHLGGIYNAMCALTTSALDQSDILRAQVVLAVAALDYYVHEVTVLGMVEVFEGKRTAPDSFPKFKVAVGVIPLDAGRHSAWFSNEVRERHSFLSFQQPEKIADAIRLFSPIRLWTCVSASLDLPESSVKAQLKLIVERRNKIAHEADIDPSYPNARWPIDEKDVQASVDFIDRLIEAMHQEICGQPLDTFSAARPFNPSAR